MKKIVILTCAIVSLTLASCAGCAGNHNDGRDTVVVEDTVVVDVYDTVVAQ